MSVKMILGLNFKYSSVMCHCLNIKTKQSQDKFTVLRKALENAVLTIRHLIIDEWYLAKLVKAFSL